jgi:hypothetical protein
VLAATPCLMRKPRRPDAPFLTPPFSAPQKNTLTPPCSDTVARDTISFEYNQYTLHPTHPRPLNCPPFPLISPFQ